MIERIARRHGTLLLAVFTVAWFAFLFVTLDFKAFVGNVIGFLIAFWIGRRP